MANPTALAGIGLGGSAAGGITSAIGGILTGQSQASMYNYQAGVARLNQQIEQQNAAYATETGEVEAQQSGMQTRAQVGTTLAQQGAGNLDVNSGSAVAVRQSEEEIGEYNEALIRSNAAKQAYGFNVQAMQQQAQAGVYGMAAQGAQTAGTISGVGTLLGTSGTVASKWLQMGQTF